MFLHLGHNLSVRAYDVIAIHDIRMFAPDGANAAFFQAEQARGRVRDVTNGKPPRALVMTAHAIYVSAISPTTLLRRMRNLYTFIHRNAKTSSK